jgi:hypothetical protein
VSRKPSFVDLIFLSICIRTIDENFRKFVACPGIVEVAVLSPTPQITPPVFADHLT